MSRWPGEFAHDLGAGPQADSDSGRYIRLPSGSSRQRPTPGLEEVAATSRAGPPSATPPSPGSASAALTRGLTPPGSPATEPPPPRALLATTFVFLPAAPHHNRAGLPGFSQTWRPLSLEYRCVPDRFGLALAAGGRRPVT